MEILRGTYLLLLILLGSTIHGIKLQDLRKLFFSSNSLEDHNSHVPIIEKINERSLSPWNYTRQTSRSRMGCIMFPGEISEAKCLLERCLDADNNVIHSLNSVPIYQEVLVVRFQDRNKTIKLEPKMISVGCTCIKSKTKLQG
ncbi:interleukin-17F-like [Aquarana catesbeiana]|uniref:interleukin-17F-like n=1 Tax=Aquarana catesbeiana TaxID=8400 RepID=UPI003CCA0F06